MSSPAATSPSPPNPSQVRLTPELTLEPTLPPLRVEDAGNVVVGPSRVCFDIIVEEYQNGSTADEIVRAYDSLNLADVHGAISYYLQNREAVERYIKRREREAAALRAKIEAEFPRKLTKKILLERLLAKEKARQENASVEAS